MLQSIEVQTVPSIRVAGIKHTGAYHEIGAAFQRLAKWADPRGMFRPGIRMLGIYYDNPRSTPVEQLRSEACIECDDTVRPDPIAGVEVQTIPGGRFAVGIHLGHYATLEQSWAKLLTDWIPAHNIKVADRACFEIYLNDPTNTKPEDLQTAIHVPVV